jgi:hypothetical protein
MKMWATNVNVNCPKKTEDKITGKYCLCRYLSCSHRVIPQYSTLLRRFQLILFPPETQKIIMSSSHPVKTHLMGDRIQSS